MFFRMIFASFLMISTASFAGTPFDHPCPDHNVPDRTVTICTPTPGAQVRGHFMIFVAHVTDSLSFSATLVFDNGEAIPQPDSSDQNTIIGIPNPGSHRITLRIKDSSGTFESSILVNSITTETPCAPGPTNQTITICSPLDGDQQTSPVELAAVTTDSNPLDATQVYVDGVKAAEGNADEANYVLTEILMEPGPHRITFQAVEQSGLIIRKTINITVH